MIESLK